VIVTNKPPCQLGRAEMRRVPQNLRLGLVAYHVCCPDCGFVSLAIQGKEGFCIGEEDGAAGLRLTFSRPLQCLYCGKWIDVSPGLPHGGKEEDADVQANRRG
jgi:hypothetical protein